VAVQCYLGGKGKTLRAEDGRQSEGKKERTLKIMKKTSKSTVSVTGGRSGKSAVGTNKGGKKCYERSPWVRVETCEVCKRSQGKRCGESKETIIQ